MTEKIDVFNCKNCGADLDLLYREFTKARYCPMCGKNPQGTQPSRLSLLPKLEVSTESDTSQLREHALRAADRVWAYITITPADIREAVRVMPNKDHGNLLAYLYGLGDDAPQSLQQIAVACSASRSTIRSHRKAALRELGNYLKVIDNEKYWSSVRR